MHRLAISLLCGTLLSAAASAEILDPSAPAPTPVAAPASPVNQLAPQLVERGDLVQTLAATGDFQTFIKLIKSAGLSDTLKTKGPFTIFAPTDSAFEQLTKNQMDELESPTHKSELQQIISYHVIPGEVTSANMSGRQAVATIEGSDIVIRATMDNVRVNNANVIVSDLVATNGIIHSIDALLLPPLAADLQPPSN